MQGCVVNDCVQQAKKLLLVSNLETSFKDLLGLTSLSMGFSAEKDKAPVHTWVTYQTSRKASSLKMALTQAIDVPGSLQINNLITNQKSFSITHPFIHPSIHCVFTLTVSPVVCMYLGLCDTGFPVQLTVVLVGFAITATHPVLSLVTFLQINAKETGTSKKRTTKKLRRSTFSRTTVKIIPHELLLWCRLLSLKGFIHVFICVYE